MAATEEALQVTQLAARAAQEKLADDIVAFDVSAHLPLADVFLLASAPNDRQVQAIADHIDERLGQAGVAVLRREGDKQGRWILLDFGDLVAHVQHEEERAYYQLERLWRDCPRLAIPERETPDGDQAWDAGAAAGTPSSAGVPSAR